MCRLIQRTSLVSSGPFEILSDRDNSWFREELRSLLHALVANYV
jgi:hypothetical protein